MNTATVYPDYSDVMDENLEVQRVATGQFYTFCPSCRRKNMVGAGTTGVVTCAIKRCGAKFGLSYIIPEVGDESEQNARRVKELEAQLANKPRRVERAKVQPGADRVIRLDE